MEDAQLIADALHAGPRCTSEPMVVLEAWNRHSLQSGFQILVSTHTIEECCCALTGLACTGGSIGGAHSHLRYWPHPRMPAAMRTCRWMAGYFNPS